MHATIFICDAFVSRAGVCVCVCVWLLLGFSLFFVCLLGGEGGGFVLWIILRSVITHLETSTVMYQIGDAFIVTRHTI